MNIFTTNDIRVLGIKLVRGLVVCTGVVAGVVLVFTLGSYAGELFGKLLKFLE